MNSRKSDFLQLWEGIVVLKSEQKDRQTLDLESTEKRSKKRLNEWWEHSPRRAPDLNQAHGRI